MKPGEQNIVNDPLVDWKNNILPLLHIKLGLMKQLVKALNRSEDCFGYIWSTLPRLSHEKSRDICWGSDQKIAHGPTSCGYNDCRCEARAWKAFSKVIHNFLGNKKAGIIQYIVGGEASP